MAATVAAPPALRARVVVYDAQAPGGPTLTCPRCGQRETVAPDPAGRRPYWRRFKPLALLGRHAAQLHVVLTCGGCGLACAPRALPAPPARDARPPLHTVVAGARLTCPACGHAECRDTGGAWPTFRLDPLPPAYRAQLAPVYWCPACRHRFSPRATPN